MSTTTITITIDVDGTLTGSAAVKAALAEILDGDATARVWTTAREENKVSHTSEVYTLAAEPSLVVPIDAGDAIDAAKRPTLA